MTIYDAELHALYQPTDVDCHALLFFNPQCAEEHAHQGGWPHRARRPNYFDARGYTEMERLAYWNPYADADKWWARKAIIAAADCEHFPNAPQDAETPVTWRWENPDADPQDVTVSPSIGYGKRDGEWRYHFFVEDGAVRNV